MDTDELRKRLGLGPSPIGKEEPVVGTTTEPDAPAPMQAAPMEDGDRTPIPQPLPDADLGDIDSGVAATGFRLQIVPMAVAIAIIVLVSGALGSLLGSASGERGQLDAYNRIVAQKLSKFQEAKTNSGESKLDVLASTRDALKLAVDAIERVESEEADLLTLEPTFEELLPQLQAFQKAEAYFDPEKVMDDVIVLYEDDVLLQSVQFAVATRHLRDQVASLIGEAVATARIGAPAGAATRTILAERYDREVPELGKIPASRGVYVRDTGAPSKVRLTDSRGRSKGEQWQMMVLREGNEEPVQVPTTDVVTLDVKPLYDGFSKSVRRHTVKRMAALVRGAHSVAWAIKWSELEEKLKNPPR